MRDLDKLIASTSFEWLPKVQKIAKSGHTDEHLLLIRNIFRPARTIFCIFHWNSKAISKICFDWVSKYLKIWSLDNWSFFGIVFYHIVPTTGRRTVNRKSYEIQEASNWWCGAVGLPCLATQVLIQVLTYILSSS